MLRVQLLSSVPVLWEEGQPLCWEGSRVRTVSSCLPHQQPGVLPSNQATLHLPSGIMSSPLRCWHRPAFLLRLTGLSFQLPIVLADGLPTCLPVTFPPLLAALEDSLNLPDLQGWTCGGRNAARSSGTCVTLWPSGQPAARPRCHNIVRGARPSSVPWPIFRVSLSPTPIKHMAVPRCDRWPGCLRWDGACGRALSSVSISSAP